MNAILIAGPTASGKSSIAVELAKKINGAVINVDSMQVYKELRVITARPDKSSTEGVPHFLYGHVGIKSPYSVAQWLDDVKQVLENCKEQGLVPVLVGGTGLYFKGLLDGISEIPPIDPSIREKLRTSNKSDDELYSILLRVDPESAARIELTDRQRVLRALEVFESSGNTLGYWQQKKSNPLLDNKKCVRVTLCSQRDWLKGRIDRRFDEMIKSGAIDEVRFVVDQKLPEDNTASKAIGLRPLQAYVRGELELADAIKKCKIETHQYAKRQETWFRNQMKDWIQLNSEEVSVLKICEQIFVEFDLMRN